ncbi:MAG: hypothetical protein SWY16_15700 [Cyanobacteriota bacterium]|nr:hypothetical protein [Cyanobacteriota bacterium]
MRILHLLSLTSLISLTFPISLTSLTFPISLISLTFPISPSPHLPL